MIIPSLTVTRGRGGTSAYGSRQATTAADLVVGRAGSSTLAEATALGLPMVVVPYPHAAGHQRANARVLVEAGGVIVDAEGRELLTRDYGARRTPVAARTPALLEELLAARHSY